MTKYLKIWNKLDPLWKDFASKDQVEALWQLYELSLESLMSHSVQIHRNKNIQTLQPFHVARHLHVDISPNTTGGDAGIQESYPFCYKLLGTSENIVYIKTLTDKFGNFLKVWEFNTDFIVFQGHVYFKEEPGLTTFYTEFCYKDIKAIYNNYGALIGHKKTRSSYAYLYEVQALWYAVWHSPTPVLLRDAITVVIGAPFAETDTTVTKITPTRIHLESGRVLRILDGTVPIVYEGQRVHRFQALTNAVSISDHISKPYWWRSQVTADTIIPPDYIGYLGEDKDIDDLEPTQIEDGIHHFHIFNVEFNTDIDTMDSTKVAVAENWLRRLKPIYVDYLLKLNLSFSNIYDQDPIPPDEEPLPPDPDDPPIITPPGDEDPPPPVTPGETSIFDRVPIEDYDLEFEAQTIDLEAKYFTFCQDSMYFHTNEHPVTGTYSYTNMVRREVTTETVEITPGYNYTILLQPGWVEYGATDGSFITNSNLITNDSGSVVEELTEVPGQVLPGGHITLRRWDIITPAAPVYTNQVTTVTNDLLGFSAEIEVIEFTDPDSIIPGYSFIERTTIANNSGTNLGSLEETQVHLPVYGEFSAGPVLETLTSVQLLPDVTQTTCDLSMESIKSYWWDIMALSPEDRYYTIPQTNDFKYRDTSGVKSQTNPTESLLTNSTLHTKGSLWSYTPGFSEWGSIYEGEFSPNAPVVEHLPISAAEMYIEPKYLTFVGDCLLTNSSLVTNTAEATSFTAECQTIFREEITHIFDFSTGEFGAAVYSEDKYLTWDDPIAGVTNASTGHPIVTNKYTLEYTYQEVVVEPEIVTTVLVSPGALIFSATEGSHVTNSLVLSNYSAYTNTGELVVTEIIPAEYETTVIPAVTSTEVITTPLEEVGGRTGNFVDSSIFETFHDNIAYSMTDGLETWAYKGATSSYEYLTTNAVSKTTNVTNLWDGNSATRQAGLMSFGAEIRELDIPLEYSEDAITQSYVDSTLSNLFELDSFVVTNENGQSNSLELVFDARAESYLFTRPPAVEALDTLIPSVIEEYYTAVTDKKSSFYMKTNDFEGWNEHLVEVSPAYTEEITVTPAWSEYSIQPGSITTNGNLYTNSTVRLKMVSPDTQEPGSEVSNYYWQVTPAGPTLTNSTTLTNELRGFSATIATDVVEEPGETIKGTTTYLLGIITADSQTNAGSFSVTEHSAVTDTVEHDAVYETIRTSVAISRTNSVYGRTNKTFGKYEDFIDYSSSTIYDEFDDDLGDTMDLYQEIPEETVDGGGFDEEPTSEVSGGEFYEEPTAELNGGLFPNESFLDRLMRLDRDSYAESVSSTLPLYEDTQLVQLSGGSFEDEPTEEIDAGTFGDTDPDNEIYGGDFSNESWQDEYFFS